VASHDCCLSQTLENLRADFAKSNALVRKGKIRCHDYASTGFFQIELAALSGVSPCYLAKLPDKSKLQEAVVGKFHFGAMLLIGATLCGCTYPPVKDRRTGAELVGPISMGTSRLPVVGGCQSPTYFAAGNCDLIFTDVHGRRVDGHRLARELDQTAKQITPLAGWLSRSLDDESKLPYELHLLTISPALVLAVPVSSRRVRCSTVYDQGCIQSQGFRGQAYWYRTAPPIVPGSFWYVADGGRSYPLEAQSGRVEIAVSGAVIELLAEGELWTVRRVK
jgi:hypothetical protein